LILGWGYQAARKLAAGYFDADMLVARTLLEAGA